MQSGADERVIVGHDRSAAGVAKTPEMPPETPPPMAIRRCAAEDPPSVLAMAGCVSTNNAAAAQDAIEQMTAGEMEEWVERMAECEAQECRKREAREEEKWLL